MMRLLKACIRSWRERSDHGSPWVPVPHAIWYGSIDNYHVIEDDETLTYHMNLTVDTKSINLASTVLYD